MPSRSASPGDAARRLSPAVFFAVIGAAVALVAGVLAGRPDVIVVGLPLALWAAHALRARTAEPTVVTVHPGQGEQNRLSEEIEIESDADMVEAAVVQAQRTRRRVFVPGRARLRAESRTRHSGPLRTVELEVRQMDADAGALGRAEPPTAATRTVQPVARRLRAMPAPPRLTGLHGAHEGSRPGQGGDFRDIHPFAPGDELRRVDWRATARAARRPGELLIRRVNALSDASAVIVMDTADDLGAVVATWGTIDTVRSGVTSLDHARSAARSIAEATIAQGDRIAFHTLVHGGRSVRSGAGRRHLSRVLAEIAASGRGGDDARFRRTPPVPHGSIIYVLSTFFDGAAAEIAVRWRALGHRVVAVDTLPELDRRRLTKERALALDVLLAERDDMLRGLASSGVEQVRWSGDGGEWSVLSRANRRLVAGGAAR